jgi:hypothetical protein
MISPENSSWSAGDISIEDGNVVVGFKKEDGQDEDVPSFLRRPSGSQSGEFFR